MMIGRNNYEEYIIDYLDGKLDPEIRKSMELFLLSNPDVAEEFEYMQETIVPVSDSKSFDKSILYRDFASVTEIDEKNFEELCIAYHEGDLDNSLKERLINYIGINAERKKIFSLYKTIRFNPEPQIRFSGKGRLKRYTLSVYSKYIVYGSSVAAVVLMLILFDIKLGDNINTLATSVNHIDKHPAIQREVHEENVIIQKEITKEDIKTDKILAAIDTNQQHKADYIRLASLDPIETEALKNKMENTLSLQISEIKTPGIDTSDNSSKNLLLAQVQTQKTNNTSDNIFIRALKLGIKGIGDITESNIELSTQTDENGNLTAFALSAGEFGFSRKMNSKLQKN